MDIQANDNVLHKRNLKRIINVVDFICSTVPFDRMIVKNGGLVYIFVLYLPSKQGTSYWLQATWLVLQQKYV